MKTLQQYHDPRQPSINPRYIASLGPMKKFIFPIRRVALLTPGLQSGNGFPPISSATCASNLDLMIDSCSPRFFMLASPSARRIAGLAHVLSLDLNYLSNRKLAAAYSWSSCNERRSEIAHKHQSKYEEDTRLKSKPKAITAAASTRRCS